jgi:hypothetical protein
MLLSQLNYTGCFLDYKAEAIKEWELIIANFVRGNKKICLARVFEPLDCGGLGIPELRTFLDAQKCTWILRANNCNDAYWKNHIIKCMQGKHTICCDETGNLDGTLQEIASAFMRFISGYASNDNNYFKMRIYHNKIFMVNTRSFIISWNLILMMICRTDAKHNCANLWSLNCF